MPKNIQRRCGRKRYIENQVVQAQEYAGFWDTVASRHSCCMILHLPGNTCFAIITNLHPPFDEEKYEKVRVCVVR